MIYTIIFVIVTLPIFSEPNDLGFPFPNEPDLSPKSKDGEIEVILPQKTSSLPNQQEALTQPKKKKSDKLPDPFQGAYPRGMYQLQRSEAQKATAEFNAASSGESSGNSNQAKMETIRILANERKISQAKSLADSIEDPDTKYKAYFELAAGIDNISNTKQEREDSIPIYLQIITEAPREAIQDKKKKDKSDEIDSFNPLLPRTRWALSNLLYKSGEFGSALDHLSRIIVDYPKSEYLDDAIFLSGKINEEGNSVFPRDTNRAIKYYEMFLKRKDKEPFKTSVYLPEVEKRIKTIKPNLKSFSIP